MNSYPADGTYQKNYAAPENVDERPVYLVENPMHIASGAARGEGVTTAVFDASKVAAKITAFPRIAAVLVTDLDFKVQANWNIAPERYFDLAREVHTLAWLLERPEVLELLAGYEQPEAA